MNKIIQKGFKAWQRFENLMEFSALCEVMGLLVLFLRLSGKKITHNFAGSLDVSTVQTLL